MQPPKAFEEGVGLGAFDGPSIEDPMSLAKALCCCKKVRERMRNWYGLWPEVSKVFAD